MPRIEASQLIGATLERAQGRARPGPDDVSINVCRRRWLLFHKLSRTLLTLETSLGRKKLLLLC
jgi:hypothetical protein